MRTVNAIFRYIGYAVVFGFVGYISYLGGEGHDYLLQISKTLIPILISLLVFYVTIFGNILKELICYKNKQNENADISGILKDIKLEILIEIVLIMASLSCFKIRGACITLVSHAIVKWIAVISNSLTIFSIVYFLLVIYDSILGLWNLIEANNDIKKG